MGDRGAVCANPDAKGKKEGKESQYLRCADRAGSRSGGALRCRVQRSTVALQGEEKENTTSPSYAKDGQRNTPVQWKHEVIVLVRDAFKDTEDDSDGRKAWKLKEAQLDASEVSRPKGPFS